MAFRQNPTYSLYPELNGHFLCWKQNRSVSAGRTAGRSGDSEAGYEYRDYSGSSSGPDQPLADQQGHSQGECHPERCWGGYRFQIPLLIDPPAALNFHHVILVVEVHHGDQIGISTHPGGRVEILIVVTQHTSAQ